MPMLTPNSFFRYKEGKIMAKWMLLIIVGLCGCAGQRTRVTLTRVQGEPAISIEFEDAKEICK
jgi:hypothetical protein